MIYCDLDGVFADFATAACRVHGRPDYRPDRWDFFEDWNDPFTDLPMKEATFWHEIHKCGNMFYREMVQPYPWARPLMYAIDRSDEWAIVTSASDNWHGYAAKKIWVDKYLQPYIPQKIEIIVCSNKWRLARSDTLLIDDYDRNLGAFDRAGGHILRFPQPWNLAWYEQHGGPPDRLDYTHDILKEWRDHGRTN